MIFILCVGDSIVFSAFLSDGVKFVFFQKEENDTRSFNFE